MMNFGFLSLDIIILIVLILVLVFLSFKFGKKLLFSLILSVYPALLLYDKLPYLKLQTGVALSIAFLVLYAVMFFILWRNLHPRNSISNISRIFEYTILIILFLIIITAVGMNEISLIARIIDFSGIIEKFVAKIPYGLALSLPLVGVLITSKRQIY